MWDLTQDGEYLLAEGEGEVEIVVYDDEPGRRKYFKSELRVLDQSIALVDTAKPLAEARRAALKAAAKFAEALAALVEGVEP